MSYFYRLVTDFHFLRLFLKFPFSSDFPWPINMAEFSNLTWPVGGAVINEIWYRTLMCCASVGCRVAERCLEAAAVAVAAVAAAARVGTSSYVTRRLTSSVALWPRDSLGVHIWHYGRRRRHCIRRQRACARRAARDRHVIWLLWHFHASRRRKSSGSRPLTRKSNFQ